MNHRTVLSEQQNDVMRRQRELRQQRREKPPILRFFLSRLFAHLT